MVQSINHGYLFQYLFDNRFQFGDQTETVCQIQHPLASIKYMLVQQQRKILAREQIIVWTKLEPVLFLNVIKL